MYLNTVSLKRSYMIMKLKGEKYLRNVYVCVCEGEIEGV
jgi:hypothetical protein